MFDFIRDLTKPAEEKRQEQITAYVDGELSPRERQRFEQLMADDPGLQAEVAEIQQFKQNLRQLPRRRVPRNFTLDPALYQAPQRQPLLQLYPAMRVATVLTAVFLIIAVSAELFTSFGSASEAALSSAPVALQSDPAEEAAMDSAADEAMQEMAVAAEVVEEETMASEALADSANVAESAPAEESAPEPQVEIAAVPEAEVMEAEEMAEESPPEDPAPAPERTVKAPPVVSEAETNVLTEEDGVMGDSAEDIAAGSDAPQADLAPTSTPAATPTPDTPRIQPTPTLADRGVETKSAATEIAVVPVATIGVEQDEDAVTAVSIPQPSAPNPISTIRLIQIALAVLLVVLGTAVWYTRRQL